MSVNSAAPFKPSMPKTPLDYISEGYWQDFLARRPIAGGMAYEAELHNCQLDESLTSLQRVDTLISHIRRDITKSVGLDETAILSDEPYRNLLLFLAFYGGRVLAKQWRYPAHWYGQFELAKRYSDLALAHDDFYQHMAVDYHSSNDQKSADSSALFFALEPIGQRLFGNIDRKFVALQGEPIASGLYQAVSERLPNAATQQAKTKAATLSANGAAEWISAVGRSTADTANPSTIDKSTANKDGDANKNIINKILTATVDPTNLQQAVIADHVELPTNKAAIEPVVSKPTVKEKVVISTPEIFTQLLTELNEIEVVQTAGINDYSQACKILDQFERHIAKQSKARSEVRFSENHQAARRQALILLKKSTTAGNTSAKLRLAMYELLGEGLIADKLASTEAGVELVKQAANAADSRGQRLLSRMYYQGIGVTQDMNNGKIWLEQAAKNGHEDAANVVAQWQQAQRLITSQKQEQHSTKRYQLLIAVVVVVSLLLVIFVK